MRKLSYSLHFKNVDNSSTTSEENQDPVKETTVQSYQKMLNQNTKKSLGIVDALFNCMGQMGMDNFGCLNSSLSLFLLCNEPAKKVMVHAYLQLTPSPPTQASMLLARPPLHPPSIHTLWMTPFVRTVFLRRKNSQERCNRVCKDFCTESNYQRSAFRSDRRENSGAWHHSAWRLSCHLLTCSGLCFLICHQTGIYKDPCRKTSTNKSRYDFTTVSQFPC